MTGVSVTYSDVQGGNADINTSRGGSVSWGTGNISDDPLFANSAAADFHGKSKYGRWDPAANAGAGDWALDDPDSTSPCIDAGSPADAFANEPEPNGSRINIGAYGNTAQASKSPWLPADANGDCIVNILDLIAIRNLLGQDPSTGSNWRGDTNNDGKINVLDLIAVRGKLGTKL
ncbi:MAG TPA: dockerin type I domain-containing protein [Planctomycetota bacterium]|nr:dockerin type I domain-containing protein [Planctomycetota bacterium]